MKISDVYTKAAESVFNSIKYLEHSGCCSALNGIMDFDFKTSELTANDVHIAFAVVFKERDTRFWFGVPWVTIYDELNNSKINKNRAEHRIFALLLMSELAKDLDL
jgi:hypothetical protein